VNIDIAFVLAIGTPAVIGEFLVWLKHRKDAAEPPCWN